ncbi:hypothetical protein PWT90_11036 [Aphanocladium album]|nr:hypothetical protein PWT90_11036 [Aphanocladium album]
MKFSNALIAAVASQTATAFRLPADATDGVYSAYIDSSGKEVYERIGDGFPGAADSLPARVEAQEAANAAAAAAEAALSKRDFTWCGCGIRMNGGDCDTATHDVEHQLGDGGRYVNPQGSVFAVRGSVVAFVCNHSRQPLLTRASDARDAWGGATRACGYYIAGTWEISSELDGGYMNSGQEWCGRDRSSQQHSC